MRIGIVADTHVPGRAKQLPKELLQGLKGVDLILHAGDWVSTDVAEILGKLAPVDGVAGNNDGEDIRRRFGRKKILSLAGYNIGIVHGDGRYKTTEQRAREAFQGEKVDVILFGHSHIPFLRTYSGVLLFNPGSPTDKRRQPWYSYGILKLGKTIEASHYFYTDKS